MVDECQTKFWNLICIVRANMTELEHLTINGGRSTSVYINDTLHLLDFKSLKTLEVVGMSQRLTELTKFDLKVSQVGA